MLNEIAKQLNISIESAYSVVHDNLQFHNVCVTWVPKELTNEHKRMHLDICSRHLARFAKKVTTFCIGSSQLMKPGFTSSTRNQVEEHAMKGSIISCCKEIQDTCIGRQVDVDHLLGFSKAYS
jgi:hypothetical protein